MNWLQVENTSQTSISQRISQLEKGMWSFWFKFQNTWKWWITCGIPKTYQTMGYLNLFIFPLLFLLCKNKFCYGRHCSLGSAGTKFPACIAEMICSLWGPENNNFSEILYIKWNIINRMSLVNRSVISIKSLIWFQKCKKSQTWLEKTWIHYCKYWVSCLITDNSFPLIIINGCCIDCFQIFKWIYSPA